MSKDLLVLADEYAAATATFARALALKDGADSMSPIARDAGDKRAVLAEALAALDTAQPVHVNVGYGELEAIMGAEFESHGFGAPESNKREYGRFRVGFASGWHSALTAAKQAQPVCGYDDETGNCTRVNCCKQAQPESHLFELWWAEYMPEAAQEQAFKAWSAAPGSKGVGVEQQAQPEPSEMTTERESYIAGLESRTHEMRKKIEQLDYELRVARSSQERATYTPPKIIDPDAPHPCFN